MDGKQQPPPQHQVFINFRGKELRNNFISHLEKALKDRQIKVLIDTYEDKGEDISKLFTRIHESKIALVVFSSRYAESRWCLDELATIKDRLDQDMLKVLPIFYKVDTNDVKKLKNEFGNNFRDREWECECKKHIIEKWKKALECVSGKIGLTLDMDSSECEFIQEIVKNVLKMLANVSPNEQTAKPNQVKQLSGNGQTSPAKQNPKGYHYLPMVNPAGCCLCSVLSKGISLPPNGNVPRPQSSSPFGQQFSTPALSGTNSSFPGGNVAPSASFSRPGSTSLNFTPITASAGMGPTHGPRLGAPPVHDPYKMSQGSGSTNSMMQFSLNGLSNTNNHTPQYGRGQASFSNRITVNGVIVSDETFVWYDPSQRFHGF